MNLFLSLVSTLLTSWSSESVRFSSTHFISLESEFLERAETKIPRFRSALKPGSVTSSQFGNTSPFQISHESTHKWLFGPVESNTNIDVAVPICLHSPSEVRWIVEPLQRLSPRSPQPSMSRDHVLAN